MNFDIQTCNAEVHTLQAKQNTREVEQPQVGDDGCQVLIPSRCSEGEFLGSFETFYRVSSPVEGEAIFRDRNEFVW